MISSLLKAVMKECRLNQRELSDVMGVSLDRVKSLTSGKVKKLTREESEALVKKLKIRAEYLLDGDGPMFQGETQDDFNQRQQAILATGRIVDGLPLSEREREGLKLCLTGDPIKDAELIAKALTSHAQNTKSVVTTYSTAEVIPMPLNDQAGLTQQEVMTLVLDALYTAKRTLPAIRVYAIVDAIMAWQRAGMTVTKSSVVEQLRRVQ